jgi:CBS domain containing-hemolysin-like protein
MYSELRYNGDMFLFLVAIIVLLAVLLIVVSAMRPQHETHAADIISLQRIIAAILLVADVLILVTAFGWGIGTVLALLLVLFYGALSRLSWVERQAGKLYRSWEPWLVEFSGSHPKVFATIRVIPQTSAQYHLASRDDLERLVGEAGHLLTTDEKKIITHSLHFSDIEVKSIMTPKSMIGSINKDEFLGPLVLSELHTKGHSRLPVIAGDIDHVVGVLHINDLLSLNDKQSETAEKVMDPKVYYIREDDSLQHALMAFLKARRHLFIVVNEFRETVGLITLEDVMESLLGHKIVDEDDSHDDLRAVAAKNPHGNNKPTGHVDV